MRQMTLSRVGLLLTNESICEIMQSTLRICFEPRLSELLRKTAQHCLNDMVQLLFTRLPSFTLEQKPLLKKLKMRSTVEGRGKRRGRGRAAAGRAVGNGVGEPKQRRYASSVEIGDQRAWRRRPSVAIFCPIVEEGATVCPPKRARVFSRFQKGLFAF